MSKYKISETPHYKPGKCANCGASKNDGRGYVDFGLEIDWYGIVYLCGTCLADVAKNAGLFNSLLARVNELEAALEFEKKNKTSLDELREKGDEIYETISSRFKEFEEFYANVHSAGDTSSSDSGSSVPVVEEASSGSGTDSTEQGTTESSKPVTKSTSGSRRANVPSLTSLIDANI